MTPSRRRCSGQPLWLLWAALALALPPFAPATHAQTAPDATDCFAVLGDSLLAAGAAADSCWYTLHIHAVRVGDSCAGERVAAISPEQVSRWIAKANEVYAAARVRFEFDPTPKKGDWAELNDSNVNRLYAELPGDAGWERGKAAGNELASHFPRKVLLLFRHGPDPTPTGGGFSSGTYNFVVLPGFDVTTVCGSTQNAYLLAHEMGHYFGLQHTFREFKTRAETAAALKAARNRPEAFDGDGLSETPPEPFIAELACTNDLIAIVNGIPFPLLRNNVMSYYFGETKTLTPQQVRIVRSEVVRRFARPMSRTGPVVPDERRDYQIVWPPNGKSLEAGQTTKEKGARIALAAWTGAPNQAWRMVPLTAQDAGLFEIVSASTGKCLTVEAGAANDGARLIQWDWEGRDSQKWHLFRDDSGLVAIQAKHSRKVLGVSASNPSTVVQSSGEGERQRRWLLLPAD